MKSMTGVVGMWLEVHNDNVLELYIIFSINRANTIAYNYLHIVYATYYNTNDDIGGINVNDYMGIMIMVLLMYGM